MESKFTVLAKYLALHILKRLCTPTPCAWPGKRMSRTASNN